MLRKSPRASPNSRTDRSRLTVLSPLTVHRSLALSGVRSRPPGKRRSARNRRVRARRVCVYRMTARVFSFPTSTVLTFINLTGPPEDASNPSCCRITTPSIPSVPRAPAISTFLRSIPATCQRSSLKNSRWSAIRKLRVHACGRPARHCRMPTQRRATQPHRNFPRLCTACFRLGAPTNEMEGRCKALIWNAANRTEATTNQGIVGSNPAGRAEASGI